MNTAKPAGLRVVLDTNVYVSAFTHSRGTPFRIWRHALERRYVLLVSPVIIVELAGVLRETFDWDEANIVHRLKLLAKIAEIVIPGTPLQVVVADPDDDRILECAVAGAADLVVSGDRHLNRLRTFRGIGIVRPADFLRTLS
jgi:putative PIN family toxin of toxin-antitoxin system